MNIYTIKCNNFTPTYDIMGQRVMKELVEDILANTPFSMSDISQACHLSEQELSRIMHGHLTSISNRNFNKLLYFYCYLRYDAQGIKITDDSQNGSHDQLKINVA